MEIIFLMNVNLFDLNKWLMRNLILKLRWSWTLFCVSFVEFCQSQMKLHEIGISFIFGDDNRVVKELIELEMVKFG